MGPNMFFLSDSYYPILNFSSHSANKTQESYFVGIDINKNLLDLLNMYVENFLDHKEKMKHIKWFCLSIRQKPHVIHTSAK